MTATRRHAGRVAVVTGGAAGIGQAFAERLAAEGARVAIADVGDAEQTLEMIAAAGGEALAVHCDVSSEDDVAALGAAVTERFGPADILVHNAGIYPLVEFAEMTFEQWRALMAVNLDSNFLLCREFLPAMRSRSWGRIVCLSSTAFHAGMGGMVHYVASKGGIIGFVRALAAEVGEEGVTVNALAPSLVRTQGTTADPRAFEAVAASQAIKRTQLPGDLDGALSFLVSDDAAFLTGQTLVVDGGRVRS
ncbi:MAG TPA: SDR family NAD(P)-dependent oxidoreductase [Solirubrobacterales bacterium]|nr:SDR family NAD(P)-dependent oxidoreductase [Solirubrobacterales bacterium]